MTKAARGVRNGRVSFHVNDVQRVLSNKHGVTLVEVNVVTFLDNVATRLDDNILSGFDVEALADFNIVPALNDVLPVAVDFDSLIALDQRMLGAHLLAEQSLEWDFTLAVMLQELRRQIRVVRNV